MADTQRMGEVKKADLERRLKTLREAKVINERAQLVIADQVRKHPTGTVKSRAKTSNVVG